MADGTACAYDFGWHDFHASGFGHFEGERFLPLPHTRWSINMIAFKMEDVVDAQQESLAEDDEKELSVVHPARQRDYIRGCFERFSMVFSIVSMLQALSRQPKRP